MDFTLISQAGLTQMEVAKMVGVSRVSVNLWVNGKCKPTLVLQPRVERLLASLRVAVAAFDLPTEHVGAERAFAIAAAVKKHLPPKPVEA